MNENELQNREVAEIEELLEDQELNESREISKILNNGTEIKAAPQDGDLKKLKRLRPAGEIDYLSKSKADLLLTTVKSLKHKVAILIMMDCGLRVSECVTLQLKNFDFRKKVVNVKSLKKRGEHVVRQIPLSARLMEQLAEYLKQLKPQDENHLLFPGLDGSKPITRKAMNRMCERLRDKNPAFATLHPHALRHTFATNLLANGAELHDVKTMLGHTSYNTTLIYNHTPLEILRKNIDDATAAKHGFFKKIYIKLFQKPMPSIISFSANPSNYIVGRDVELEKMIDNLNKNVNTILLGGIGVGKSHLMKQLDFADKKILKVDELTNLKLTFLNLLLYLLDNDKEAVKQLLYADYDRQKLQTKLQRDSVHTLIGEIIAITAKHEYILMIDNVDGITAKGMKAVELLKDHFVIITTAREIPVSKANFLWNFEKVDVQNLNRSSALELIHRLSYDMEVEDFELYRNHIYDQSNGNPRVIFELVDRYRKEIVITDEVVRGVRHIGGLPEWDMSFLIVLLLAGVAVMRYTSREIGGTNLRFIGGMALVLLMLSRFVLSKVKRKFI
jgi:site-specific recombinase XerC